MLDIHFATLYRGFNRNSRVMLLTEWCEGVLNGDLASVKPVGHIQDANLG